MKQSKLMSFVESTINILVGFGIACVAQAIFLPMLGVPIPWDANFAFAGIMTVISIVRSFVLRRVFEALHIRRPLSSFMQAVIAERFRQIEGEGWSIEHDDAHERGTLAVAGGAYARKAYLHIEEGPAYALERKMYCPNEWPWELDWWKPTGFRRDLVKAAALILAEGEKFDRSRKRKSSVIGLTDSRATISPESKSA